MHYTIRIPALSRFGSFVSNLAFADTDGATILKKVVSVASQFVAGEGTNMFRGSKIKAALLIVWLLWSGSSQAALTVNNLLVLCESEQPADQGMCLGFVTGVKDAANLLQVIRTNKMLVCLPEGVTDEHVVNLVIKGLKIHPDGDNQLAVSFVLAMLGNAFQCK